MMINNKTAEIYYRQVESVCFFLNCIHLDYRYERKHTYLDLHSV